MYMYVFNIYSISGLELSSIKKSKDDITILLTDIKNGSK
jgi:hypothetical protein